VEVISITFATDTFLLLSFGDDGGRLPHLKIEHMFDRVATRTREDAAVNHEQIRVPDTGYPTPDTGYELPVPGPGRVAVLSGDPGTGMTRLGFIMLSRYAPEGTVAYLDTRGWLSPIAAWESGIDPDGLVIARCGEAIRWGRAAAALLDGTAAVFAEVPPGVQDPAIRKLAALARNRGTPLLLRPIDRRLPSGIAHLTIEAVASTWSGTDHGHGRIERRRIRFIASGKAMRGMTRTIEMEDDGSHTLRVVPGVAAPAAGDIAG